MAISPTIAKGILAIVPEVFKDKRGKWSSKRTVSGVLAGACVMQIEANGLDINSLLLALISVLPLCFSVFEKK
ncbi:hypothetical protein OAA11_02025 [Schleiferiaceae bacterium]|nr:hypothetical protein [Schleiferiaceae bacterium]